MKTLIISGNEYNRIKMIYYSLTHRKSEMEHNTIGDMLTFGELVELSETIVNQYEYYVTECEYYTPIDYETLDQYNFDEWLDDREYYKPLSD